MGNILYISLDNNLVQLCVCGYTKLLEETFQNNNIETRKLVVNNIPILQITFQQSILEQIGSQKVSILIKDYSNTSKQKIKLRTTSKPSQLEHLRKFISFQAFAIQQQTIPIINGETYQKYIEQKLIYNFKEQGLFYDMMKPSDLSTLHYLSALPEEFLEIYYDKYFSIDKVNQNNRINIFNSPYNQYFTIKLIKNPFIQQTLGKSITSILEQVYTKGNSENADLLLQDLCGPDKCSFIGYPPKLIAANLAKYANEKIPTSNIWDQLQSVVNALAINTGIMITNQIHLTKIYKIVFRVNQFSHRKFLQIIQSFVGQHAQIWFIDTSSKSWIERLQLLPNFLE